MSEINDGGPAFPTENERQTGANSYHYTGMTLRDYIAAKVIPELIATHFRENKCTAGSEGLIIASAWEVESQTAYAIADAMIWARTQPTDGKLRRT